MLCEYHVGPILTNTNIVNFMTKIGLRLGILVNTASDSQNFEIGSKVYDISQKWNSLLDLQSQGHAFTSH